MSEPLLIARGMTKEFGGLMALFEVDFQVEPGEILAIIGPNGAGKTTAINIMTGIYPPTRGEILFGTKPISGLEPYQIAGLGISRTFQNLQVFHNMTVLENVMVGLHTKTKCGFIRCMIHALGFVREEKDIRGRALDILELFKLGPKAHWAALSLPYGDQKRLEIARALVSRPKLIMLDEPVAGLNAQETEEMARVIRKIKDMGIAIILVEHDMNLVMEVSDRIIVLNYGRKIAEGTAGEIQNNPEVITAYLGSGYNA